MNEYCILASEKITVDDAGFKKVADVMIGEGI